MMTFIDIGSTIIKIAELDNNNTLSKTNYDRNYNETIYDQVLSIINNIKNKDHNHKIMICSSANGGIRVGIVCLTKLFSGEIVKNYSLSIGANVLFVELLDNKLNNVYAEVDILLVVGGIDCKDMQIMKERMLSFEDSKYTYNKLFYAGNSHYAKDFKKLYPKTIIFPNILSDNLEVMNNNVFEQIRDVYLHDIISKDGVSKLQEYSITPIWPTPKIVNIAFEYIMNGNTSLDFPIPFLLIDIGGATTDVYFSKELLNTHFKSSKTKLTFDRYVFTELGVNTSEISTLKSLSKHRGAVNFFNTIYKEEGNKQYFNFREDIYEDTLSMYAAYFLTLDALLSSKKKGLLSIDINKVNAIVITGGASQKADPVIITNITKLFVSDTNNHKINIILDTEYEIWVLGISQLYRNVK